MYITANDTLFKLTDEQLATACRVHTLRQLEAVAQEKLSAYAEKHTDALLHPFAIYAPSHIDYLAYDVAERFLSLRKETVTDNNTWKRAIEKELAARKKLLTAPVQDCFGPDGDIWLCRPTQMVLRHAWNSRLNGNDLAFCLERPTSTEPEDLFCFSFLASENAYAVHLQNPKSYLMYNLEPEEVYHPTFEAFCKEVRSLLKESIYLKRKAMPKYLWVRR